MDLVDRYLYSVGFWLPDAQKRDIIAELSEDIRSQIEEQESARGRTLMEDEIEQLLKKRGRPLAVAGRFLPQRSLISPLWFPAYWLVLRIVALCYLLPWAIILICLAPFNYDLPSKLMVAFLEGWASLWSAAFFAWGAVTLVFVSLEHFLSKDKFLDEWSPRKLPRARPQQNNIPRLGSGVEVGFGMAGMLWWIQAIWTRTLWNGPGIRVQLADLPLWVIVGFILLSLFGIGNACLNLVRPYWTYSRAALRLAHDLVAGIFLGMTARISAFIVLSGSAIPVNKLAEINRLVNFSISLSIGIAAIACLGVAVSDVLRISRLRGSGTAPPVGVASGF